MSLVVAHKSSPWLISLRRVKTTPTLLPLRFMLRRSHVSRLSKWLSLIVATFFKRWHVHVARGAWTSLLKLILLLVNILHIKTKTPRRFQRLGTRDKKTIFFWQKVHDAPCVQDLSLIIYHSHEDYIYYQDILKIYIFCLLTTSQSICIPIRKWK